ncbi:restriction endonuclease subunit S [Neisseria sp.]
MRRYESYKDSGVEWLGKIPSHWDLTIGMNVFRENKRDNKGMKEKTVLSLSYGQIIIKPEEKLVGLVPESFETYQIVEPNDIIIRCTDLQNDQTSLRTGLAKDKGIITSAYLNLKVINNHSAKFLHYYLHALDITKVLYKFGSGLRQNLSFLDFKRLPIIDISLSEQQKIAQFLDDKTAKIDQAVDLAKKQIALLKEHKQILIQNAVTRGLNPDVPLKDSGVEWIGQVPEHWELTIGMNVFRENKRDNKGMKENTVLSLSYGKIIIKPEEKLFGLVPESFETYQIVEPNDIIIRCTDLQNDQTSLRTGLAQDKGIITSAYLNLKVINNYSAKFLHYYLHALDITKVLYKFGSGLRQNLSFLDFKRLPIIDIPLAEQQQIADYLDAQIIKIDQAIALKTAHIEKLKEYKSVLINDVVTGKVRV